MTLKEYSTTYLLYMLGREQVDERLLIEIKQFLIYKEISKKQNNLITSVSEGIIGLSVFIDFLWAMLYIAQLTVITLSILSVIGLVSLALGGGIAWVNYHKSNKKQHKLNRSIEITLAKEAIYNVLLHRQEDKIEKRGKFIWQEIQKKAESHLRTSELKEILNTLNFDPSELTQEKLNQLATSKQLQAAILEALNDTKYPVKFSKPVIQQPLITKTKPIHLFPIVMKAAVSAVGLTSVLFGSLYVGAVYMLAGTAVAAFLINPIAIAIAISCISVFGIMYGVKYFQQLKETALKHKFIKTKNLAIENTIYQYEAAKKMTKSLDIFREKIHCAEMNEKFTYANLFKKSIGTKQDIDTKQDSYQLENMMIKEKNLIRLGEK